MAKVLSAGVIPLRRTWEGWRILVLRAYKNWDFPKGRVEPGEEPLDAAKREATEETGLTQFEFPFGDIYRETLPYAGGKVARYYLAETSEEIVRLPISHALGRPEHHEYRWVSFDEAEDLLPPRLALVLDWARETLQE
ncbi:MAG TPA: NUDIX domain-containing protein [Burkholderiales bacterium]|nr:NUDIX domain-containing protein [Burkholderiales bacterium]